ncbi:MAG: hypothetical protein K9J13_01470 [Saprospiraceae bacterium]|nr:hypothetical protein [Saprospiraceae bacterium]
MKKTGFQILALIFLAILISGCLTVEKKEYTFEFTGKNSGTLTIKYVNIMSSKDDDLDVSKEDFDELISKYLNGDEISKTYPEAKNIKTRIFEENGKLCGEAKMDFAILSDVKLYQQSKKSPYMLCLKSTLDSETYYDSNGNYGGEIMPVVFWPKKLKKLTVVTKVSDDDESTISLLSHYNNWK